MIACAMVAIMSHAVVAPPVDPNDIALEIARVRELYHLTDTLGDRLWPGFDTRRIAIAIKLDGGRELLVGHRNPPEVFRKWDEGALDGVSVAIRDGYTRHLAGTIIEIGGEWTAYLSARTAGETTESWLGTALHECFHCYQRKFPMGGGGGIETIVVIGPPGQPESQAPARNSARHETPPELNPTYAALVGLESLILQAALQASEDLESCHLGEMFVAVRHEKWRIVGDPAARNEEQSEVAEGTAQYVQLRLYQLLAESGGIEPVSDQDPFYRGFGRARQMYETELSNLRAGGGLPADMHSWYRNGMAQCFLLDRLRPDWKLEMEKEPLSQFRMVEEEVHPLPAEEQNLLAGAKERFGYEALLQQQEKQIEARLSTIRHFIAGDGLRYWICYDRVSGRLDWQPEGPVYQVPAWLEEEIRPPAPQTRIFTSRRTVWSEGMRRFRMGEFSFESAKVPVIIGNGYLEWIDREPGGPDDMQVRAERQEGDLHYGVAVVTKGFTLVAPKATIVRTPEAVEIRILP
ncbi:MAG: hypothetical protein AB1486_20890 [Planctomycetota bacterium]